MTEETDDSFHGPSTRDFYQDDQSCYIMDAKSMGNIGRYLNVSQNTLTLSPIQQSCCRRHLDKS